MDVGLFEVKGGSVVGDNKGELHPKSFENVKAAGGGADDCMEEIGGCIISEVIGGSGTMTLSGLGAVAVTLARLGVLSSNDEGAGSRVRPAEVIVAIMICDNKRSSSVLHVEICTRAEERNCGLMRNL